MKVTVLLLFTLFNTFLSAKYLECKEEHQAFTERSLEYLIQNAIKTDVSNSYNILKFLLRNNTEFSYYTENEPCYSILQHILISGNIKLIEKVVTDIKDINKPLVCGYGSILDFLIDSKENLTKSKYRKVYKLLKDKKAISLKDKYYKMYNALKNNNRKVIKNIIEQRISLEDTYKYLCLNSQEVPDLNTFIKESINLNKMEMAYYCILGKQSKNLNFEEIKKLLNKIITPQNINKKGFMGTPIMLSILKNDLKVFNYFIKIGANLNVKSNVDIDCSSYKNITPLELAINRNNLLFIERLFKLGAISYNKDFLFALKSKKRTEMIKLFLKYNYNFKFIIRPLGLFFDYYYIEMTPLIIAIKLKYFDIAKMIYSKTYLNYIEPCLNKTALDYSIEAKNKEIISLFRKHGAKRSCEILKTKCKPLNPEIEKILKNDKK